MTNNRRRLLIAALGLPVLGASQPLSSQQPPPLVRGQRVRVTAPAAGVAEEVGTLEAVTADSVVLWLERANGSIVRSAVSRTALQGLEVSVGRRSAGAGGKGALIGALVGGTAGALAVALNPPSESSCSPSALGCIRWEIPSQGSLMVLGGVVGAAGGALVGWAVGSASKTDVWVPVKPAGIRVTLTPQDGGRLGLGASLAF